MSEVASEILGLYERHASAYDEARGKMLFEAPWLERFRALLPTGGSVLDIGCGSAEPIARHLIEKGHAVSGIDGSPSLIQLCRTRFPNRDWQVADMRGLSLGHRFDGLIAWDSFFHLTQEDQRGMFATFRAHAAENAALMFTSGPQHGEAIGSFGGERFITPAWPHPNIGFAGRERLRGRRAQGRGSRLWRTHHLAGPASLTPLQAAP